MKNQLEAAKIKGIDSKKISYFQDKYEKNLKFLESLKEVRDSGNLTYENLLKKEGLIKSNKESKIEIIK
ncbi:hypothetical protein B6S12_03955 [Helicobacter valdiviensis]|uniref:Uncharacterized protein n=1 Tax=Helicobacter valdiviensis TaxID=1458358 RepID=A0A2W6MX50_9HELI|nr:hypothetical protein [Helicobacter valdiviensis]PZT48491.1 hypothetical protein B6S12_03955 [Helicobacter valdiviensis]